MVRLVRQIVHDRGFRLALSVLYVLAILFFSVFHLGNSAAGAAEGDGQSVRGQQFSICYGNGDAGGASSTAGVCAFCSISSHSFGFDNVSGVLVATSYVHVEALDFSGPTLFGCDHGVPPSRGPPIVLS